MDESFPLCESWATLEEAEACKIGDAWACSNDDEIESALRIASYVLYGLSGFKYRGHCERVEQPPNRCRCGCLDISCVCTCDDSDRVMLSGYPVREIVGVEIDGVAIDADQYRLVGKRWLLRMADDNGNRQFWPTRNRLDVPLGDPCTWAVTYEFGTRPPEAGVDAAIEYAKEIAKACSCDDSCALPANVQNYVRQGVAVTFDLLSRSGLVGTPLADDWLRTERYAASQLTPAFYNPDDWCAPTIVSTSALEAS